MLNQYKNILGKPGIGFHSHFGTQFALLDIAATGVISYYITKKYKVPYIYSFSGLMITGIILHKIFGVDTTINKFLFR